MFYGIVISMYYNEHLPPHFHAKYQEHEALFTLDGEVLSGSLPRRQLRLVAAWTELHEDDLKNDWEMCAARLTPMCIEGIRF